MNIRQAKQQIKNAMTAYFAKDDFGNYLIPVEKQRPVMLIGPPGIGKTAVMEQIAGELGVGLLSYSMTHHTRQSALGLPFIVHKTYGGRECDVSEYTMSEIISSIYDMMEVSGVREGILFLDEINCVSETLEPLMLQFLQYKVFGRHRVPEGWIVVTAGNPPEYNSSVRDFDIVTWDRLKRIDVEPDFDTWKEYAYDTGVHPSIMTYLENKRDHFYSVETTVDGKRFVTARGWDDLSRMIVIYEQKGIPVDGLLIEQYLQNPVIAKDFALYYDLFNKYRGDYQVGTILEGNASAMIKQRAAAAPFDERLAFVGLVLDAVFEKTRAVMEDYDVLLLYMDAVKTYKKRLSEAGLGPQDAAGLVSAADPQCSANQEVTADPEFSADSEVTAGLGTLLEELINERTALMERKMEAKALSSDDAVREKRLLSMLKDCLPEIYPMTDGSAAFGKVKAGFDAFAGNLRDSAGRTGAALTNVFAFFDEVFGEGQEVLILVTEITLNSHCSSFISRFGCDEYFRHNKELMFYERQTEIISKIENLDFDEGE